MLTCKAHTRAMKHGNFYCVEFVTGEWSARFADKKAAEEYLRAANAWNEQHGRGPVARRVVRFVNWEEVK